MVHGPGPWTGSMGWSMDRVHGVVHGPWSMFCNASEFSAFGFSLREANRQKVKLAEMALNSLQGRRNASVSHLSDFDAYKEYASK